LAGLWTHQKGGFFHDGRFATLLEVVNHYDTQFNLNLSEVNKRDLVGRTGTPSTWSKSKPASSCHCEQWLRRHRREAASRA
jgi:hypothetical protein